MRKIYIKENGGFMTEEELNARVEKFWGKYEESIATSAEELRNLFKREEKEDE